MKKIIISIMLFVAVSSGLMAGSKSLVYKIDIRKEINATTQLYLSRGMAEANSMDADAIIIHLNTYGGQVDMADSMRTAILYSRIPVYVFVDNNAASAGALISIAAKKIYMREGASIGAATVVNQSGEAMPDKYQSYLRAMMRSTAEAHGRDTLIQGRDTTVSWVRDPAIAEAMVDESIVVPGLIDSGKVLTFTAEEAIKWGYCDGLAESVDEVITKYIGYKDYELATYTSSFLDEMKGLLQSPYLQSILILIIIGGIYFELQTPGIGFPSAASLIAAILYFAPLYIDGLAQNWEILVFVVGLILIAVEIFIIPGLGIPGIAGIIMVISGLTLSLLGDVDFDFQGVGLPDYGRATMTVLVGLVSSVMLIVYFSSRIGSKGLLRKVALNTDLTESTVSIGDAIDLVGKEGRAATVLRPSGKIIIDGEIYDSISETGFIDRGAAVRVIRVENTQLYVEIIVR